MARQFTAEEAKTGHIQKMGEPLGEIFHALWQEVAWLHTKWSEYVELFGTKESRITLINEVAPLFFRVIQDTLWEDTILHIARLTDPATSPGRKTNLTIQQLPALIDDSAIKEKICGLIDQALQATEFCRDWRNRHIAHRDLTLAMKKGADPLAPANRALVKTALNSIAAVLNTTSEHYTDSTITFEVIYTGGAVDLLYTIDDGLQADAERRKRIEKREFRESDYAARDL